VTIQQFRQILGGRGRSALVAGLGLVLILSTANGAGADPYDDFRAFAESAFGAEHELLVYETYGGILDLPRDWWEFV
jgi:hypothetical protein